MSTCVNCGGVAVLRPDEPETGARPTEAYCAPCWQLVRGRELVASGQKTDYPGLPHGGADMQQPGDALYDLKLTMFRAWRRPNPYEDGSEMGE